MQEGFENSDIVGKVKNTYIGLVGVSKLEGSTFNSK